MRSFYVGIIGGGPSGLATAATLAENGIRSIVFDSGSWFSERRSEQAFDLAKGIGGAGLFSDGKFSYYPANSYIYHLPEIDRIKTSYIWLVSLLKSVGIDSEPFPDLSLNWPEISVLKRSGKKYITYKGSLSQRVALLEKLTNNPLINFMIRTSIVNVKKQNDFYILRTAKNSLHKFKHIVFATGKFGAINLNNTFLGMTIPQRPLRYEFGLRIEVHKNNLFNTANNSRDFKKIWNIHNISYRTFCTCTNGEVLAIPYEHGFAISGRSEGNETNYSNFGILARYIDGKFQLGEQIWNKLRNSTFFQTQIAWQPLNEFLGHSHISSNKERNLTSRRWLPKQSFLYGNIKELIPSTLYNDFVRGINPFITEFPEITSNSPICFFPCIEGVGYYPVVNKQLQIPDEKIWFAGDVVGRLRGLIAALLSGHYIGQNISKML